MKNGRRKELGDGARLGRADREEQVGGCRFDQHITNSSMTNTQALKSSRCLHPHLHSLFFGIDPIANRQIMALC